MNFEDFRIDFKNVVQVRAELESEFSGTKFVQECAERLLEAEEVPDLQILHYEGEGSRNKKIQLQGFGFDDVDLSLILLVSLFSNSIDSKVISKADVVSILKRGKAFISEVALGPLAEQLEPSSAVFGAAIDIKNYMRTAESIRIYLVTDDRLSDRVGAIPNEEVDGIPVSFHVWDLQRFFEVQTSKSGRAEIAIDLSDAEGGGLPALKVSQGSGMQIFLFAISGQQLANIYSEWGSRLLEGNVRSFLSLKSSINKGLRNSLLNTPELFMAYNNGLTTTAESVELFDSKDGLRISSIKGLQIVNGGQTTASLFHFLKNEKNSIANLDDVFVQVKLMQVNPSEAEDMVPNIARFANSQNKVAEADFFSNSPFHIRLEDLSRRELAPAKGSLQYLTYWFYERARGQYLNEKSNNGAEWLKKYPAEQKLTKTDLAKYYMAWAGFPQIVSQGAQKNFMQFAIQVTRIWEKDPNEINALFYRECIGKAIIYNSVRKRIMGLPWYQTGYLANITAYSVARFALALQENSKELDFELIWQKQIFPAKMESAIDRIAFEVHKVLLAAPGNGNVTEWAKTAYCWDLVSKVKFEFTDEELGLLVRPNSRKLEAHDAKKIQKLDSGIVDQTYVVELGQEYWDRFLGSERAVSVLTEKELSIARLIASGKIPTELQSQIIMAGRARALANGFV
jgi:hypothetical protein